MIKTFEEFSRSIWDEPEDKNIKDEVYNELVKRYKFPSDIKHIAHKNNGYFYYDIPIVKDNNHYQYIIFSSYDDYKIVYLDNRLATKHINCEGCGDFIDYIEKNFKSKFEEGELLVSVNNMDEIFDIINKAIQYIPACPLRFN